MSTERELLERLVAAAAECASDLQDRIEAEYPNREQYPTERRRFDRDIATVERVHELIIKAHGLLRDGIFW